MNVYYNEIDPYCAAWLQNLMDAGQIPQGVIDTRSIEDVRPDELAGFTQCHFFAGLGGWAYALELAGWGTRPVWTGSCPCQPFSAAGKGAGFADERHLWPAWQHLIAQCRPPVIFGEQVASKDADAWIDLVHADLEGMGYTFGCVPFPAAGVGAPHIRDRNYWLADADQQRRAGQRLLLRPEEGGRIATDLLEAARRGEASGLADAASLRCDEQRRTASTSLQGERAERSGEQTRSEQTGELARGSEGLGRAGRMAKPDGRNASAERQQRSGKQRQQPKDGGDMCLDCGKDWDDCGCVLPRLASVFGMADAPNQRLDGRRSSEASNGRDAPRIEPQRLCHVGDRPGPTNGQWRAADWLACTDGKWRPVEPGAQPLAHGIPNRVGRLRAFGNAIVPQAAAEFVMAYMEARDATDTGAKEAIRKRAAGEAA